MGFGVLAAGLAIIVFLVFRVIDAFPSPAVSGLAGSPITATLDGEGLTLLVDDASYSMDCTVTDAAGQEIPISSTDGTTTITINNHSWWVVAESTDPTPPGEYTADCDSADAGLGYAMGERGGVGGFVVGIFGIIGTAIMTIIVAITLFVVGAMKSRRQNRQPNMYYPNQPIPGQYPPPPPNPYQTYREY